MTDWIDELFDDLEKEWELTQDTIDFISSLMLTSTLSEHRQSKFFVEVYKMTQEQVKGLITLLYDNQRDAIAGGFNYSQGDIQRKLKRL